MRIGYAAADAGRGRRRALASLWQRSCWLVEAYWCCAGLRPRCLAGDL